MGPNDEFYVGREQTYIKHLFLTRYLQDAAFKTFQSRSPVFNFVDGFAGPWNVKDENDLSDTSFYQSIQVLRNVRQALGKRGVAGLRTRFHFCERNPTAFESLRRFADQQSGLEINLYHGDFEDHLKHFQFT